MVCADGIRLATRLWRPTSPGPSSGQSPGPWPVLLMRQPYGRAIASTVTYAHPRWYADQGFLVVVQDVRGCGDSEGEFAGFGQEAADGAAAVRWCRRLAGSNGRVGTYGFSYQGLSQLLIAAPPAAGSPQRLDDPLPDCTAPAMCGVDERLHWATEGGAHWWSLGLAWGLQLAAARCRRRGDRSGWQRIRASLDGGHYLEEGVELLERFDPGGMARGWLRLDPRQPDGWSCHPVPTAVLRRPMLLIGGWHDPQLRGVLDLLQRAHAVGGRPRLRIGAWTHLDWRGGIDALQLRFFRRHLSGAATGSELLDATALGSATIASAAQPGRPAAVPSTGGADRYPSAGDSPDPVPAAAPAPPAPAPTAAYNERTADIELSSDQLTSNQQANFAPANNELANTELSINQMASNEPTSLAPASKEPTNIESSNNRLPSNQFPCSAPANNALPNNVLPNHAQTSDGQTNNGQTDKALRHMEPAHMEPANNQLALQCLRSGRWWRRATLAETARRGWRLRSRGLAAVRSQEGELLPIEAPGSEAVGTTAVGTTALGSVAGDTVAIGTAAVGTAAVGTPAVGTAGGGTVVADTAGGGTAGRGGRVSLVHDPWRPVPSRGGHLGPRPGLVQRQDLDGRSDVACFTAPPLLQPLRLIGRPRLKLPLRADQPAYDLCVALAVVQGDGSSLQLCTGLRRILAAEIWQRTEQLVELQPLAVELQPGERLRCAIAAAAWPAIAVNPGDGSMPGAAGGPDQRIITLELDLLGAHLWLEPLIGPD